MPTQHPSMTWGHPSDLEYMRETLQKSHVSTCGDATSLGSIAAIDIAIGMLNTACGHAEGGPQGFPFLLAVPVWSATNSVVLSCVLFM